VAGRIEDYAIIGGMQAAALVCSDGSIDAPPRPPWFRPVTPADW